jgi:hypothetical protein
MTSMTCDCGCCHSPDRGACPTFEPGVPYKVKGSSLDQVTGVPIEQSVVTQIVIVRCVYCDHQEACHERDKHKPVYNTPLGIGFRESTLEGKRLADIHRTFERYDLDYDY